LKAIIATGFGKLHFHETARALAAAGVEVNFLTGWVPKDNQTALVDLLGRFLGEKHLAARMAARQISIPGVSVTPVAWVEVAGNLHQTGPENPGDSSRPCLWHGIPSGRLGQPEIPEECRCAAGAQRSRPVGRNRKARSNGLAIVTDHSIAHPAFMHRALREEFARFGMPAGYDSRADLWKLVLRDCADADLLLVNSDFVKKTFVEQGYPAGKVRVAYLGVREEFFDLKRDYRIDGPVRILFTGNFDIRKGVRLLLEAIRRCRRSGLDVRLELMGNLGNGAPCLKRTMTILYPHTVCSSEQVAAALPVRTYSSFPRLPKARRARNGSRCRWFAHHYDRELRFAAGAREERDLRAGERFGRSRRSHCPGFVRRGFAAVDRQKCNENRDGELYLAALRTPGCRVPQRR
jgi:hypothetical protein